MNYLIGTMIEGFDWFKQGFVMVQWEKTQCASDWFNSLPPETFINHLHFKESKFKK